MLQAGEDLDRQIARKLNGDVKARVAPYSTSETAAARLVRRLAREGMSASIEESGGTFFCTIQRAPGERLSVGSAASRPLAIARAVLHAPMEVAAAPVPANDAHRLFTRGSGRPAPGTPPQCGTCGGEMPSHVRRQGVRICGVCSWKRIKSRFAGTDPRASLATSNR